MSKNDNSFKLKITDKDLPTYLFEDKYTQLDDVIYALQRTLSHHSNSSELKFEITYEMKK